VRDASEAAGKILAKPPERVFMTLTDHSPRRQFRDHAQRPPRDW
jgi:hypothetical protein